MLLSMRKLIQRPMLLPQPLVTVLAVVLVGVIGVADYVTGWELQLSALYLLPIAWACWSAGRKAGLFLAVIATIWWFVANLWTGYVYRHPAIPYWNALMLLLCFLAVVELLAAFQSAHYHLEETVQERTAALQMEIAERQRLEKAKLQAERLAAVGTMAAEVAHEVRNPLGSITLNLDLISKEIDHLAQASSYPPAEGRVLVNEMRTEVHRIQRVIEDYLQFARLPKAQRRPVAVNELLDQKLAFLNSVFQEANVNLQTEFDPSLTTIQVDPEQLWQAVLNLVRNGLEAMSQGGTLTITTRRQTDQAVLRVTDTGKGMTEEQTRQVFVPFFSTKGEGTGLGLVVVQQIVSEHGGHVECESTLGKGSKLTIFLPLKPVS
jgi:signal transduction histidine kinase